MFSRFHRRGPSTSSTPTSPIPPEQWPAPDAQTPSQQHQPLHRTHHRNFSSSSSGTNATTATVATEATAGTTSAAAVAAGTPASSTGPSSTAPSLPPIARVTSVLSDISAASSGQSLDAFGDMTAGPSGPIGPPARAPSSAAQQQRQPVTAPSTQANSPPRQGIESPQPETGYTSIEGVANMRWQGPPQDLSTAAAAAAARMAASPAAGADGSARGEAGGPATMPTAPPMYGTPERRLSRAKPPPPPINTSLASRPYRAPPPQPATTATAAVPAASGKREKKDARSPTAAPTPSFATPTDLQSSAAAAALAAAASSSSAAPNHATMATNIASSSAAVAAVNASASARTKKSSLPFLMKNPVSSLLGRRSKMSPDLDALSAGSSNAPVYVPIRGTRVHDFSASRDRRAVPSEPPVATSTAAVAAAAALSGATPGSIAAASASTNDRQTTAATTAAPAVHTIPPSPIPSLPRGEHGRAQSPSALGSVLPQEPPQQVSGPSSRTSSATPDAAQMRSPSSDPRISVHGQQQTLLALQENRPLSVGEKPLPDRPFYTEEDGQHPGEGNNDNSASAGTAAAATSARSGDMPLSVRTASTRSRAASTDAAASLLRSGTASTGTSRSRNHSEADVSPGRQAKHEEGNGGNDDGQPTVASAAAAAAAATAAALPKHMKSTSSRFSFMVGSAGQEQLLEERHRQKQLEKKAAAAAAAAQDTAGPRDSRFDDSDDDFDYDAMADDDGLEERIPGVNADADEDEAYGLYEEDVPVVGLDDAYEEEDVPVVGVDDEYEAEVAAAAAAAAAAATGTGVVIVPLPVGAAGVPGGGVLVVPEDDDPDGLDPNNDQENFAGFVFQRSNPASSLVTPSTAGMAATPRDAGGRVIGYAVTMDNSPGLLPLGTKEMEDGGQGGEEGAKNAEETQGDGTTLDVSQEAAPRAPTMGADDLYFDQGLADELSFAAEDGTSTPFDESIFDRNDTDLYGRPIPGAFARAQAERAEAQRAAMEAVAAAARRDSSGMPSSSQISDGSQATTAHTSVSMMAVAGGYGGGGYSGGGPPVLLASQFSSPYMGSSSRLLQEDNRADDAVAGEEIGVGDDGMAQPTDPLAKLRQQLPPILTDAERVAAYQAALAEAAFRAAASGKFRRDSMSPPPMSPALPLVGSPPAPADGGGLDQRLDTDTTGLGIQTGGQAPDASPTKDGMAGGGLPDTTAAVEAPTHLAYAFTSLSDLDYDYDWGDQQDYGVDDDFDLDDATVEAANADVLASDSEGFYGREFNFYAAAPTAPHHHHHHHRHSSSHGGGTAAGAGGVGAATDSAGASAAAVEALPTEVQYANGGFFIPAGVGRSTSGRVVSREPNLTPITERSEYSNRNSVLSMGLPPLSSFGSFGGGSGTGSGSGELRSPGLAQLALLADENDMPDMTLSALLRLRSRTFGGGGGGGGGGSGSQGSSRAGSPMLVSSGLAAEQQQLEEEEEGSDSDHGSSACGSPTLTGLAMVDGAAAGVLVQQPPPPLPPTMADLALLSRTTSASLSESGLWMRGPGETAPAPAPPLLCTSGFVGSPTTMTMPTSPASPGSPNAQPLALPPPIPAMSARRTGGPSKGHRHKGSADSISYVKEEEAGGETRWVMERRRITAETGEVELLEREVVEGI